MMAWRPWENASNSVSENASDSVRDECVEPVRQDFFHHDLEEQTQRVVLNIYDCLKNENRGAPLKQIVDRICVLTKISRSTIYRVIKEGAVINHSLKRKRVGQKLKKIDMALQEDIRRIIYRFYSDKLVPTLEMIRDKLREFPNYDYSYKSLDTLRYLVRQCGFRYGKIDKRMAIMESARIVEMRQEYLRKIKNFRAEKRTLIYLDETWFDTHDVVQYGWVDNSKQCALNGPCNRGKRIIILHAGSENGFVSDCLLLSAKSLKQSCADYHEDMTAELFEKWIEQQLLPNIPPNSVIIMDNAPYHSRQQTKIPNLSTKKGDIIEFMQSKNMEIPQKPTKKILLELIKKQKFSKEYYVDTLMEQHGHEVLRLPPYYCIFNPIELVWATLKQKVRKYNQTPQLSESLLTTIKDVVTEIAATDLWKKCVQHVIGKENEYCVSSPIDPIIISLHNDSSSESDGDDDI